jgi:transcriptional pleiotropic regulator of transition state genes
MTKKTGMVRKLDALGRITLPIELRRTLEIDDREPLEISVDEDRIILAKYRDHCAFCDTTQNLEVFKNGHICHSCKEELKKN